MKLAPGAGRNPGGAWGLLVGGAAAVALIGWVFTIHKGGNSGTLQMEHHIQGVIANQ